MNTTISRVYKLSDEEFSKLVAESTSCTNALKKLGYNVATGNPTRLMKKRINELGLLTAHWCTNNKKTKFALFDADKRVHGQRLIKALLADGREYKCECCGISTWQGKTIILQLHHRDGDRTNNKRENLAILCPNCHSQTDTFSGKNIKKQNIKDNCISIAKSIPMEIDSLGKRNALKLSDSVWEQRKTALLTSGIDFSKYGWVNKAMLATGLTYRQVVNTVKRYKDIFDQLIFIRKIAK